MQLVSTDEVSAEGSKGLAVQDSLERLLEPTFDNPLDEWVYEEKVKRLAYHDYKKIKKGRDSSEQYRGMPLTEFSKLRGRESGDSSDHEKVASQLFVPANEVSTTDWDAKKVIADRLVVDDFVTKGGNFPIHVVRYYNLCDLVRTNPGITVKKAGEIAGIPKTPLYRYVNKMVYDDGIIQKKGSRLYPIGEPSVPPEKKKAHGMTLKFYKRLGRTVLQGLCDYLEGTELFKRGADRKASITSKNAKEQNAQCITISCSESPFEADEIIELREEIWKYTEEKLGTKCRFSFSRVEIGRDIILTSGNQKLPVKSITVTRAYRMLVRGYVKKKKDGQTVFRTETIENGTIESIIQMVEGEGEKTSVARENAKLREALDTAQKEKNRKDLEIDALQKKQKNNNNK